MNFISLNNTVEFAKNQLKIHKEKGVNSTLSIFEVAQLMDTALKISENKLSTQYFKGFSLN